MSSRKAAALEDLDFLLVVMLVHFFDEDGLDDFELLELVLRGSRQFNVHRATVPQFRVQSRSEGMDA